MSIREVEKTMLSHRTFSNLEADEEDEITRKEYKCMFVDTFFQIQPWVDLSTLLLDHLT